MGSVKYPSRAASHKRVLGVIAAIFVVVNGFLALRGHRGAHLPLKGLHAAPGAANVQILSCAKTVRGFPAIEDEAECAVKQFAGVFVVRILQELKANHPKSYELVKGMFIAFLENYKKQVDVAALRQRVDPEITERYERLYFDGVRLAEDIMEYMPHDGDMLYNNVQDPVREAHWIFAGFFEGFEGALTMSSLYRHGGEMGDDD